MAHILVVDDEPGIRELLFEILDDEGHHVDLAENAQQAREARLQARPDLVLLDIWMPDTDGISLLKEWASSAQLTMPVIMMSGHATIETAVTATKLGALSFLEKPITLQKLMQAVDAGLKKSAHLAAETALVVGTAAKGNGFTDAALATQDTANGEAGAAAAPPSAAELSPAPAPEFLVQLNQPLREAKEQFEVAYFSYHLEIEHGAVAKVAEKTGLERTHLYRKLKQLGIDPSRSKIH